MKQIPAFTLVTGNRGKQLEVERLLGWRPDCRAIDLPELQSLDLETVLRAKGEEAWRRLEQPLVVDETGLSLAALHGFPGPLVKWMLQAIGAAGIARLAEALGDHRASAHCSLLFRDHERTLIAAGEVAGRLVMPRGEGGFGWDPIFVPDGCSETYAELPAATKDSLGHRGLAWRHLAQQLTA